MLGSHEVLHQLFRQTFANYECKMKFAVAFAMGAIEVFEFLATFQLVYLLTPEQYNLAVDSTLYSYGAMMLLKLVLLLWMALDTWTTTEIVTCKKIV